MIKLLLQPIIAQMLLAVRGAFFCLSTKKPTVLFVLGGPGCGKGTQSTKIQQKFKFTHLSAGQLLRKERMRQGSQDGELIEDCIVSGRIVPSRVTVRLLEAAMQQKWWNGGKFLVDGFPRNIENLQTWNQLMGVKIETPFIVFLDCSQQTMLARLQKRGESSGRSDDNLESIRKRFKTYQQDTMQVIEKFKQENRVVRADCEGTVEQIFGQIEEGFQKRGVIE